MHLTDEQVLGYVIDEGDAEAAAHIDACPVCRGEVEAYQEVLTLARNLPGPPPDYAEKIWRSIRWRLPERPKPLLRRPWFLALAASTAVAVIAGSLVWRASQAPSPGPPVARAKLAHVPPTAKPASHLPEPHRATARSSTPKSSKSPKSVPPRLYDVITVSPPGPGSDAGRFAELVRCEDDAQKKKEAIQALASLGSEDAGFELVMLYHDEPDPDMRRVILQGLSIQQNPVLLQVVSRMEKDPSLQREILVALEAMPASNPPAYLTHGRPH